MWEAYLDTQQEVVNPRQVRICQDIRPFREFTATKDQARASDRSGIAFYCSVPLATERRLYSSGSVFAKDTSAL
jgi:hypothetical protein